LAEQLVERILKPLGLVVLSRERIQETLEEAVERGRVTRSDANELVALLVQRGRQQTDELVERLVRGAEVARRRVGVGPAFPIIGYDDLTVAQIRQRLGTLDRAELRKVRTYERRHAARKTVLTQIEKRLG
jgi:hypothetical protein